MALESNPDQASRKVKHAMWVNARRGSSSSSISPSVSLTDTSVDLSSSLDSNIIRLGLGNSRKHGAVDLSLARVHSVGRANDGFTSRAFQPDLINHNLEYPEDVSQCADEVAARLKINNIQAAEPGRVQNGMTTKKNVSDATKPNIPGNSVVLSDFNPGNNLESYQVPVVATDKLQPYPPGLITIVKEGPAYETPSSVLLASFEKELEALESPQLKNISNRMAPDEEIHLGGVEQHGIENKLCHCRIALEERLHATIKGCLELKHQVELADSKCARWEKEAGESSECVSKLRSRVSELEIELSTRNASLHGLKAKVAQQFMENDDINERRRQFERDCKAQLAQLDSIKKSEQWFREQLHLTQVERSTLQKELMSTQEDVVRQAHELERLRSDLKRVQDQLIESEEKSLKEKQNFTMRLEKALAFSTHLPNIDSPNKCQQMPEDHAVTELKQRVSDLELSLEANNNNLERSGTEIDRLLSRSLQLQRELSETKIRLQEEEERLQAACKDRDKAEAALQERERALAQLSQEHTALSVRLEGQNRERAEQDEALQTLTRNFTNVSSRFHAMRAETQRLREDAEAQREEARAARAERDAALARLEDAARREQAHAVAAKLQAGGRCDREAQLEGEVRALREGLDSARGAQQRAEQLHAENLQLAGRNDSLQAQVQRLSALLQQNTGSGVRDQALENKMAELQEQERASGAQAEQLQAENGRLQSQVHKSSARLAELTHTLQVLESEMAELKQQLQMQQGQDGQLVQLRAENSQLQRDKHDLSARVDELSLWLDTVTQGLRLGAEGTARERLRRLSTSPVHVEDVQDGQHAHEDARAQLEVLRDANSELAVHAAALQRKLDALLDKQGAKLAATNGLSADGPDLLASSGKDLAEDSGLGEELETSREGVDDASGLRALLQVCLYRARQTHRVNGLHDGHGDHVLGEDSDRRELTSALSKLAASLDVRGGGADADALEALEERANRRDDLVRALLGRLKDQVLARKAAEEKLAQLAALGTANGNGNGQDCHACAHNGGASAAGDGLSEERDGERERLEQEVCRLQANIAELHLQLFNERRDLSQLRKEVSSLRLGLDTANDMLDSNKVALGRSEAYGQVLKVSKEQLELRFEKEQREHEECRLRLERALEQLQEARAKDPLMESNIKALGYHLHQRSAEVRALQDSLALRDQEQEALRVQMERQKAAARRDYEALQREMQQAQREFSEALMKMSSNVPDPVPCDEEGLSALIQESNRLSPAVLDDLKALLHNLKADLKSMEREVGVNIERTAAVVQHV